MTQVLAIKAVQRAKGGKGNARQTRRDGQIPAVIYGDKQAPVLIAVDHNVLLREVEKPGFFTHLYDVELEGKPHRVLPRDVQFDPVTDWPVHADFLRVSGNTKIRVLVPVAFRNSEKAPGIKRGGTLNVVLHEIELWCQADSIPEKIEVDLTGLEIGDNLHLANLPLPAGTKLTTLQNLTVASIAAPTAVRDEALEKKAAEAAAAAAPAEGATAEGAAVPAEGAAAAPAADAKAAAPAAAAKGDAAKKPDAKK
ncbi:MAG: 50S ribosomal protein L25/general stress protein Ctc [Alphaproteobacteria bacterium]|nr:50S ribosomal protein L25/general stress protein Ctc [Alphaproteobacteria bacterium]